QPVLLQARAGQRTEHLLSLLRQRLRGALQPGRLAADQASTFEEDLAEVARLLEARAFLVFLDDVHRLDVDEVAATLGYLSRLATGSRPAAPSRPEPPLPQGAPTPVRILLHPLDGAATAEAVAALSLRMGLAGADAAEIFRRSGGSPFLIWRELSRLRYL